MIDDLREHNTIAVQLSEPVQSVSVQLAFVQLVSDQLLTEPDTQPSNDIFNQEFENLQ
jgi:hypothetical protein